MLFPLFTSKLLANYSFASPNDIWVTCNSKMQGFTG